MWKLAVKSEMPPPESEEVEMTALFLRKVRFKWAYVSSEKAVVREWLPADYQQYKGQRERTHQKRMARV